MSNETELRDFLKKQAAAMRRGGTTILIFGIILVVALLFLYTYSLNRLHREWEAAGIVDYASSKALVAVDGYIENAEQWILDNAPKYMDDARKSLVENAPKIRGQAEDWVGMLADDVSSRVHDSVSEQVRDVMKEHSKEIREALDAAGDVQKSETAEYDLQKVLEAEFEQTAVNHVDRYLPDLLRALQDMDAKMKLYVQTAPEKLTEEQRLEREFVMVLNTLFERGFGWARQKYPVHVGE